MVLENSIQYASGHVQLVSASPRKVSFSSVKLAHYIKKKKKPSSAVTLLWQNLVLFSRASLSHEYKDNRTLYREPINQLALTASVQEMHLFSSMKTQFLLVAILHTVKVNFSCGN